jgi:hypothetical protein
LLIPGTCSQALVQLVVLGALNIITDIMLIVLPMPALLKIRRSLIEYVLQISLVVIFTNFCLALFYWKIPFIYWTVHTDKTPRRLQLVGLFSLGLVVVVVTIVRLPLNYSNGTVQVNRTTWASTEALAAALVANIPTIYTLRRARQVGPNSGTVGTGITSGSIHLSRMDGSSTIAKARFHQVDEDADDAYGEKHFGDTGIRVRKTVEVHHSQNTKFSTRRGDSDKKGDVGQQDADSIGPWGRATSQEELVTVKPGI